MRNSRGAALIEFAFSLILLTSVFTGIFGAASSLSTYNKLVNAVRTGSRYASLRLDGSAPDPKAAQAVRNFVVYGDPSPAAGATPVTPGLSPENVEIVIHPGAVTVSIRGFAIDSMFSKIALDGRPTVTFPLTGVAR